MCVEWINCRCPLGKTPFLIVLVNPNFTFIQNPSRHGFLVADAGGGTLDISSYAIRGTSPLVIEEIAPPDCMSISFCNSLPNIRFAFQVYFPGLYLLVVVQGRSFKVICSSSHNTSRYSYKYPEKLRNSKYGTPDALDHITKRFDETTKRLFRDYNDLQFIPFGSPLDKDLSVGIRGGQLKLTG